MRLWTEYKEKALNKGVKADSIWQVNWTQPHPFEDRYDMLPE